LSEPALREVPAPIFVRHHHDVRLAELPQPVRGAEPGGAGADDDGVGRDDRDLFARDPQHLGVVGTHWLLSFVGRL